MPRKRKKIFKYVGICMSPKQYEKIWLAYEKSCESSMSNYARKILFGQPVKVFYRDRGFDDFIEAVILLRKDLTTILEEKLVSDGTEVALKKALAELILLVTKIDDY